LKTLINKMRIININDQRIFILIATILMYALGGGIAHYLGALFLPFEFLMGLFWVISIQISGFLLTLRPDPAKDKYIRNVNVEKIEKKTATNLQLSRLSLSFSGVYIAILLINNKISVYIGALIIITLLGLILYSIPPFYLSKRGYQEICLVLFQGCLVPAISFFILVNYYHRMLFLILFPMTLLALAYYIALNFSTFAHDQKIDRKTFVQRYTWQRSTPIHHILLISGYLFFLLGLGMGLPQKLIWVSFLTFPLAIYQIYWLIRITRGGRPLLHFFKILAASVYGLTAYLFALTLWIN